MASNEDSNELENFLLSNSPVAADELKDAAEGYLRETEELKENCLRQLKDLIKDHKVLCVNSDDFLLRFLRTKKFDVQRSFKLLLNYAHHRAELHNRLLNLQPETLKEILNHNICGILPYRDSKQRLICFYKPGAWNSSICTIDELVMGLVFLLSYASEDPSSQTHGVVTVYDWNFRVTSEYVFHLIRYLPFLKKFFSESVPLRYREGHVIYESSFLKYVLPLSYPFIPSHIWKNMKLHGRSRDAFFQYISPTILPDEYGGNLGPLTNDHLVEAMTDYRTKMIDEQDNFLPQK